MKTMIRFSFIALSAILAIMLLRPVGVLGQTVVAPTTTTTNATDGKLDKLVQALNNYRPLNEITALTQAGIGDTVILTYIQNSATTYNVGAQDIIKLREQGVSPEVITALIQHGTEVRPVAPEVANTSQANAVASAPAYQPTPVVAEVSTPVLVNYYVPTPVQPVSTVSVTYFGSRGYSYAPGGCPSYVTFGSGYCYTPRAVYGVGYGGHRFGGYRTSAQWRW